MKRLIAANWKMNFAPGEASLYLAKLAKQIEVSPKVEVVICAPFVDLYPLAKAVDAKQFKLGAQNLSEHDDGPHTGEISGSMLKGLVDYVLVGHSERRAMGETDRQIAAKLAAARRHGLVPILCVGETLNEREHGLAEKVVVDQLTADLHGLTAEEVSGMVIAYEPVWAINHGQANPVPATPEQCKFAFRAIRHTLEELYGEAGSSGVRLLYGGSVDPDHAGAFLAMENVDGLLPGTASLNVEKFKKIVAAAA